MKNVFSEWIDNGHNNFANENTIILCIIEILLRDIISDVMIRLKKGGW